MTDPAATIRGPSWIAVALAKVREERRMAIPSVHPNDHYYVRIDCAKCGKEVGYVVVGGHRYWLCTSCAEATQPKAIDGETAVHLALATDASHGY